VIVVWVLVTIAGTLLAPVTGDPIARTTTIVKSAYTASAFLRSRFDISDLTNSHDIARSILRFATVNDKGIDCQYGNQSTTLSDYMID
jgi:hypothetical protein